MKHRLMSLLPVFVLVLAGLSSCNSGPETYSFRSPPAPETQADAETAPPPWELHEDILFASPGGIDLKMDIAVPRNAAKPAPLLLYFPGNSYGMDADLYQIRWWKEQYRSMIKDAASRGYVAVACNHRPLLRLKASGEAYPFGAILEDARGASRFLFAHAREYGIDTTRFAVLGWSSGGHVALQLAMEGVDPEGSQGGSSAYPVKACVISCSGIDPTGSYRADPIDNGPFWIPLMGARLEEAPERWRGASPVNFVSERSPATFLISAASD
ncbi:MAG: alpha/beta hydrolase, partial [Spirochaetes bacterium]|nr:alpha/beta hydrolase [Spirochaetota bacterium]